MGKDRRTENEVEKIQGEGKTKRRKERGRRKEKKGVKKKTRFQTEKESLRMTVTLGPLSTRVYSG